ncbi:AraC family transcriptional regulator [Actinomadura sp. DC4]|uniref:helix-turn-helix transcriptional regulator n=1 Tax=Actinomadura sp. DC4 TaxID=3055069 RepID=UPI0025AF44BB|nr:AraC family transcriptional regulator [Actinomadura sp. DC4]MDN3352262.1 AraC family transcriptional regulator [Actinomadura sp. DC4]
MTDPVERFSTESLLLPDSGARVMRPRLRTVDVHWHDYYELCLVVSGAAEHVVNGVVRPIGRGSAFLLSPADFHAIRPAGREPLGCYNTVIDPGLIERQLADLGPPSVGDFPWQTDDFLGAEPDLRRLQAELEEPRLGSARLVEALVGCLVVALARHQPRGAAVADDRPGVADELRAAVRYVDRHFREPISLADAARRAHLSPNYFSERFRDYTGSSFQLYLQERRLRFARSLLASTSSSVTEVCHAAGFNSLSHFGRAYRRRYGTAPSDRSGGLAAAVPGVSGPSQGDVRHPNPLTNARRLTKLPAS